MSDDAWEPDPLPLTVPSVLHNAMRDAISEEFAVSYLCGALVHESTLHPRTLTALLKLKDTTEAMRVLKAHGIKLGDYQPPEHRILIPAVEKAKEAAKRRQKW